jgi:hypothetical protein
MRFETNVTLRASRSSLANDQGCSMQPAEFQRFRQLRAITALAAFNQRRPLR